MFKRRYSRPGSAPATLNTPPPEAQQPVFHVTEYSEAGVTERKASGVADLPLPADDGKILWIEMNGLADVNALKVLGEKYGLHPLALEDVLNLGQRPKLESFGAHLFVIAQMIYHDKESCLCGEQVSIFIGHNLLISIQEDDSEDVFTPVRERIRGGGGYIRKLGADYLAYALLDSIVDHCFPVLEKVGEALEEIEEDVLEKPGKNTVTQLHGLKRSLMQLRRFVWPERDVVSALLHSDSTIVQAETKVFLRDLYDHTVQIMDLIESYRDATNGLVELYLSSVSLRTNETMRVLTVMSSIFIPLTFVVGLYGMNFQNTTADGSPAPTNMPEIHWKYGYVTVISVMAVISICQIIFFKKKKWL
jgi:magnesium transporter